MCEREKKKRTLSIKALAHFNLKLDGQLRTIIAVNFSQILPYAGQTKVKGSFDSDVSRLNEQLRTTATELIQRLGACDFVGETPSLNLVRALRLPTFGELYKCTLRKKIQDRVQSVLRECGCTCAFVCVRERIFVDA